VGDQVGTTTMKLKSTCSRVAPLLMAALLLPLPSQSHAEPSAVAATATDDQAPAKQPVTESQRRAKELLAAMANHLAGLPSLSVSFRDGYDVVQSTGQKVEFGETRRITLARPNQLRVEEITSDGRRDLALFDGKNITVFDGDSNVYARTPQPGTVDDALVYFVRDLRMRMPLARLLSSRLPSEWPKRVTTVDYVESAEIDGLKTHHIAGRTDAVDFQYWIMDGPQPLPLRVVLTYVREPGQPQFWANFSDWSTSPQLTKSTFVFAPSADAKQIGFAAQTSISAGARQTSPTSKEIQP
jgi:hypothetical protein